MPGMNTKLSPNNPTIVSAFHSALLRQGLAALAVLLIVLLGWSVIRTSALRAAAGGLPLAPGAASEVPEPLARRVLRIGFALLWVLDGLLQAQAAMPLGMVPEVIDPTASSSSGWVQHLVNAGSTIWSDHPITAASAAVWIQLGIGLFLLLAPRGTWSRLAGLSAACWGLIVWVFGESFGGLFAPGASWLFGAPGAVLFYVLAGILIVLPEEYFRTPRLGRVLLGVMGLYYLGMSLLQGWPGRGFWTAGPANSVASMSRNMAQATQPSVFSSLLRSFGSFDAGHAVAVNGFVVAALALIGVGLLSGRPRLVRAALVLAVVVGLSSWLLVQDLGVFGGVGTDPNSMVPILLVLAGGYLGLLRPAEAPAVVGSAGSAEEQTAAGRRGEEPTGLGWLARLRTQASRAPSYVLRALAGVGALAIVAIGAVPMAVASVDPHADAIVTESYDGTPDASNFAVPNFTLEDQFGRPVSLSSLTDKVVVLTFLDPVCTSDCPLIAQEMRSTDLALGAAARSVEFVAVVSNPIYRTVAATQAFDRAENMTSLPNWLYLTGSLPALEQTWSNYGIQVAVEPAGAMIGHGELTYVIDHRQHARYVLDSDPGPGTNVTKSSFSTLLTGCIDHVLSQR
jgi:cytochrome oxidase Cu insertion factor (SCO1/SenC/PrrC family)